MGIFGKSLLAGLGAFGAILFLTMLFWSGKGEENKGGKDNE